MLYTLQLVHSCILCVTNCTAYLCICVWGGGGGGGGGGTKVRDKNMFFQKPCFFVFLGCFWGVFLCSENMFSWKHVFLGDVDLEPVNGSNKHIF